MTTNTLKQKEKILADIGNIIEEEGDKKTTGKVTIVLCFAEGGIAACKRTHEYNTLSTE